MSDNWEEDFVTDDPEEAPDDEVAKQRDAADDGEDDPE
jgi:hypothetical protein